MSKSTIAELYSKCMFSFLRNGKISFQSNCIMSHGRQQHGRDPVSAHSRQYLTLPSLLFVFSRSDRWLVYLIVLLIYVFLTVGVVEYLFTGLCIYILHICSLVRCVSCLLSLFMDFFFLLCVSRVLGRSLLSDGLKIFSPTE